MSEVKIAAEPRTEFGKGAARRIRRANKVPAVVYGHGGAPRHISLPGHELMLALKSANVLLQIDIEGTTELTLPKDVQRDPVKGFLEHVDLVVVRRGEKVTVEVPIHVVGTAGPGSLVAVELATLAVEAEATSIPAGIEVSVEGVEAGSQILAKDVVLPDGVGLIADPDALVVNVGHAPVAEVEGEAEEESAGEEAPAPQA